MSHPTEQVLTVRRLKAFTVFQLLFVGQTLAFLPLGVLFGVMACFGADTVKWNGEAVHGAAALLAGPAICLLIAVVCTAFLGAFTYLGLRLYARFRPLHLRVVPAES